MDKWLPRKKRCAVFFDSGIGGLNLMRECVRRVPRLNYIYCADNANVPYGGRSAEEIYRLTRSALEGVEELQPLALVIACNTVTASCIERLRKDYSFPVIGIQPAIKQAAEEGGRCLVLATETTAGSAAIRSLVEKYGGAEIKVCVCNGLAEFVEQNVERLPEVLPMGLLPSGKADSVVLGCTHYVFVKKQIEAYYKCPVFDGIAGTADHFAKIIGTADHLRRISGIFDHEAVNMGKIVFFKGNNNKNKVIFRTLLNNKE